MERPVFKTFAAAEGFMEILKSSFLALMLALRVSAIEPSQKAIEMTERLKNNRKVSCCELKSEYRRLALKLHPDKDGTVEDMTLLNNARDSRKDCSQQKMRGCTTKSSNSKSNKSSTSSKSSNSKSNKSSKSSKSSKSKQSKSNKSKKGNSNKSKKGKSNKSKKGKSNKSSTKSKKTQEKSFDGVGLFAGGVVVGGVVGLVINAKNAKNGCKSHKTHVRNHTSPRHK